MKKISWKAVGVLLVILVAVIYLLPTIEMTVSNKKEPTLWPYKKINLGLDLQGGMHLVLEVDSDKAVESTIDRIVDELRDFMKKRRFRFVSLERKDDVKIHAVVEGEKNIEGFEKILDSEYKNLKLFSRNLSENTLEIMLGLPDDEIDNIKKMASAQALETIRNRIDQFGVSEPDIRKQGEKRILIQLPGVEDTERAKKLIGKTALLEFKLLDENNNPAEAVKGRVPPGSQLLYQVKIDRRTGRETRTPYLVKKRTLLTGSNLTDARVQIDSQYNEPYVGIKFDKKGGRIFGRITGDNVGKRLAIVLDNIVYSAPTIQEKIPGGEARITGSFSMEEARDLSIALRAGALPAPVKILEERTVGPSLGTESIQKGLMSMIVGGVLVVIFMAIYYMGAGLIADLALIVNVVLVLAGLAAFQATLTLPGIAGLILTIGMAVDANVLIFERIREERSIGKTDYAAVTAGFDRAALTILDANVTTLIAALVLFQFGTGPVKGFAVTLSLGVLSSLFTALILSRLIFDYLLLGRNMKKVSIG